MDHPDRIEPEILQRNAVIMGAYLYGLADADEETCRFLEQEIHAQIAERTAGQISERKKALWKEAGQRAVNSLGKIRQSLQDAVQQSEDACAEQETWTEPAPDYACEKGSLIPVRKVLGCMSSSLWPVRENTLWEQVGGVELNTLLFWADGKRSLWDIALHTAVEMNKCTDEEIKEEFEMAAAFFGDMAKIGAVEWR
jgi:hypothetical protein